MTRVGSLTKKLDFQKIFSKTNISLISFQQLDLNRHDLWNMRLDSRTRKIVKQEEHQIEFAKSSTKMTSTLLHTPWKVETPWGNTVDFEKENKQYEAQLGGKERWLNEESVNGGQYFLKKDIQWTSTFRSHRGQYCSKTIKI
jgi:hypothetical protein